MGAIRSIKRGTTPKPKPQKAWKALKQILGTKLVALDIMTDEKSSPDEVVAGEIAGLELALSTMAALEKEHNLMTSTQFIQMMKKAKQLQLHDAFWAHCKRASKIVDGWPDWKKSFAESWGCTFFPPCKFRYQPKDKGHMCGNPKGKLFNDFCSKRCTENVPD